MGSDGSRSDRLLYFGCYGIPTMEYGLRGGPYGECDPGADHLGSDAGISSDAGL